MGAMTSLSNRECADLLKGWGFAEAGFTGGHMIMEYEGRRVQISAPGRSAKTPYRALRKAAKILGISLKDLLKGKNRPEPLKEETVAAAIITPEVPESALFECPVCGKTEFKTERGFKGHLRSHETTLCQTCGNTFSLQGFGSHRAKCSPPKRGRGRPRRPIAEVMEPSGRRTKVADLGVEVPDILDTLDEEFPPVEAFSNPDPAQYTFGNTPADDDDDDWDVDQFQQDKISLLLSIFFPARTLDDEQTDEFLDWVEATKALLDTL